MIVCVALFLFEIGGANFVWAQKRSPRLKRAAPLKPRAKPVSPLPVPPAVTVANVPMIIAVTPSVTKIDFEGLKALLKSNADARRPLLVNFWATWCPPCREEFPDLVKLNAEYSSQGLSFVTVSLDDLAEIDRDVPVFLNEMKSNIPAYLLKTDDEETAIHSIAPEWRGALPLTVLYNANGKPVFTRMGAIKPEILRIQIEKVISQQKD